MMIRLRSRRGVSGAISAMFVIAIFFIILISLFVYTGILNSYNQTVNQRAQMDWERDSESVRFIEAAVGEDNKILNVSFSNDGGVTLHLTQVWLSEFKNDSYVGSQWQLQYWISRYVSSGETVNDLGFYPEFKRVTSGAIGDLTSLSNLNSQYYKIKVVTERGNSFECQVPYPPTNGGNGGGVVGGYVLQIDNDQGNFQYAAGIMTYYDDAYSVPGNAECLYRVMIRNMTPNPIILSKNSTMSMMEGAVGQVTYSYIVASSNDVTTRGKIQGRTPDPYVDNSLTIPAGEHLYVYFGATAPGGNQWATNPNHDFLASFILVFHFEGDPSYRTVPTPVIYVVKK